MYSGDTLPDYEPYTREEFPGWANDLRRGEIIFFGTVPFTFFISTFLYDFYLYNANSFSEEFAPAILGNKTPPVKTKAEKLQIIAVSVSFSAILSVLDYLLGKPWNE
ncbi:MAG: hypothetical protein L3J12_02535 [Spirochaetales bacterium]|nr:hypothetical protein [Spirochaetales bacterium]